MMKLTTYFSDFLQEIRPTENQRQDYITGHKTLRKRLEKDDSLAPLLVCTFLQGSYRRATAVRPVKGKKADVDVIVVTKLSEEEYKPEEAINLFVPFAEKYYKGKYKLQGRSIGIELSYVELDIVVTSAPSESEIGILQSESVTTSESLDESSDWRLNAFWVGSSNGGNSRLMKMLERAKSEPEWKLSPLRIPDREKQCWHSTHPLAQIQWTRDKNKRCNGHYVNVVKALKWWRRLRHSDLKYPKGYPFEHLIGVCCPDEITSVAEGITYTLESITKNYQINTLLNPVPFLPDHGVPEHNVFGRITGEEFAAFYSRIADAALVARQALDAETVAESVKFWQELFGSKFPDPPTAKKGGYTQPTAPARLGRGRFG